MTIALVSAAAGCYDPQLSSSEDASPGPDARVIPDGAGGRDATADAAGGNLFDAPPDAAPIACPSPLGECYSAFVCGTRCYSFCWGERSWVDAETECGAWGGTLVSIGTNEENGCVYYSTPISIAWIGASQPAGSGEPNAGWRWSSGEPFSFTHWAVNEPNDVGTEDCAEMFLDNSDDAADWNDADCAQQKVFVCERAPL